MFSSLLTTHCITYVDFTYYDIKVRYIINLSKLKLQKKIMFDRVNEQLQKLHITSTLPKTQDCNLDI
jgi:hypothetical protein